MIADILKISKSIKLSVKMKNVNYFMEKAHELFGQPNRFRTEPSRSAVVLADGYQQQLAGCTSAGNDRGVHISAAARTQVITHHRLFDVSEMLK